MNELSQVNFHNASSIFATIDHNIAIVHAVLEGNSPGKIFVDTPHSPTIALLYAEDAFFYVVGDENSASTTEIVPPEKIFASKFCSSRWVLLTRNGGPIHPRLESIWRAPYGWRCAGQRVLVCFRWRR